MESKIMHVEKILVANRGEIAVRIIKTIQSMGFTAVAVFSDADRYSLHVQLADEAYFLGHAPPNESYLNIDKIIQAAQSVQADAIHPGYGFLSENAHFSKRCADEKLIFIGPSSAAIQLMGSKSQSKHAMIQASVPCIPGYQGEEQTNEFLIDQAKSIGFPLMIKAAAGGGGRGMRIVQSASELNPALSSARSEAQTGFGNPELILEKAIIGGRHIEIQILADSFGHCLHLGERDCSLQRRHQKVIEEAPSPIARLTLREAMGSAAITAAQTCNYVGAGTVEFLVDENENFYFLEMNTRIQVEHPVTELVTGIDIVEEQIRVALGEPLRLKQADIKLKGHAIEARLYAEDPEQNYLPQTGTILLWQAPSGEGVRCDSGITSGIQVCAHYDPMLAKIVAHGDTRQQALRRLSKALRDTQICGLKTNRDFLIALLNTDFVREGQFNTTTLENASILTEQGSTQDAEEILALASLLAMAQNQSSELHQWALFNDHIQAWEYKEQTYSCHIHLHSFDHVPIFDIQITQLNTIKQSIHETVNSNQASTQYQLTLWNKSCQAAQIGLNGRVSEYKYQEENGEFWLSCRDFSEMVRRREFVLGESNVISDGSIQSPMDGRIVKVLVSSGQEVQAGDLLAILDAMKIEHPIKSPFDGTIIDIKISEGQQVKNRQKLIQVNPVNQEA